MDDWGNITKSCSVGYPRRSAQRLDIKAQESLVVSVSQTVLLNKDEEDRYELGIELENTTWEISGILPPEVDGFDSLFWLDDLNLKLEAPLHRDNVIHHDATFTGLPEARLAKKERFYYWNDARDDALPWGGVGNLRIRHHSEEASFASTFVDNVISDRLEADQVRKDGLYRQENDTWWKVGPTLHYLPASRFNLLAKQVQTYLSGARLIEAETLYAYDSPYWLVLTGITDAVGNQTVAESIDYHLPAPNKIKDPNENIAEVIYDPLGIVVVATQYGQLLSGNGVGEPYGNESLESYEWQGDATFDDVLSQPERFLQRASTYYHYDLGSWIASDPQPLRSLSLKRESFVHDGEGSDGPESRSEVRITYIDGLGRVLQAKEMVESGPAIDVDQRGDLVSVEAQARWRTSGHTAFDSKQQIVRQFEPFFSPTHTFQSDDVLETFGVSTTTEYDPLGRVIRVQYPNGAESRTEYFAWKTTHYDPNDSVSNSAYETSRAWRPDEDPEKQALQKALDHANTPTHLHLDPLGREVERVEEGGNQGNRHTATKLDIGGNPTKVVDRSLPEELTLFVYRRDMLGRVFHEHSADAGDRWTFSDALDRPVHLWDGRDVHRRFDYDALNRPVSVFVDGALGLNQYTERMEYGDQAGVQDADLRNLRGQLYRHYDQAGVLEFRRYDPTGQPLQYDRQLLDDYKREPNWTQPGGASLVSGPAYETSNQYDAIGRVVWQRLADGTTRQYDYQLGGGMDQIRVSTPDGQLDSSPILTGAAYNARVQRTDAALNNGVAVRYGYDPTTFRLQRLFARKPDPTDPDGPSLRVYQDIRYTYDPIGNITQMVDHAQQAPSGDVLVGLDEETYATYTFRYDPFYQLREATGRVHEALQQNDYDARSQGAGSWIKGTRHLGLNNAAVIRRYTRDYDYDIRGNLRRIDHRIHLPNGDTSRNWRSDLWVSENSNRSLPSLDLNGNSVSDRESRFDANGNCSYLPHIHSFEWSYRNALARAVIVSRANHQGQPDDAEYYVYGGNGLRVRKVHEKVTNSGLEVTEKIYLDGCEIKRISRSSNLVLERKTSHINDGEQRLAILHQWTVDSSRRETDRTDEVRAHYQLSNHLGSSSIELGEDGSVITFEEYFPYGGTAFIGGRSVREIRRKDYRYSGKECDDVTGLNYYGYRYHAAWIGRWLSPDPIGPEDGLNLYRFVRNNPINLSDPNGLQARRMNVPFDRLPESVRLQGNNRRIEVLAVPDPAGVLSPEDIRQLSGASPQEIEQFRAFVQRIEAEENDAILLVFDPAVEALREQPGQLGGDISITRPPRLGTLSGTIGVGRLNTSSGGSGREQPSSNDNEEVGAAASIGGEDGDVSEHEANRQRLENGISPTPNQSAETSGIAGSGPGRGRRGGGAGGGGSSANVGAGSVTDQIGRGAGLAGSGTGRQLRTAGGIGASGVPGGLGLIARSSDREGEQQQQGERISAGDSTSGVQTDLPRSSVGPEQGGSGLHDSSGNGGLTPGSSTNGSRLGSQDGSQSGSLLSGGQGGTQEATLLDNVASAVAIARQDFIGYDPDDPAIAESGVPGGVLGWLDFGKTANQGIYISLSLAAFIVGGINEFSGKAKQAIDATATAIMGLSARAFRRAKHFIFEFLRRRFGLVFDEVGNFVGKALNMTHLPIRVGEIKPVGASNMDAMIEQLGTRINQVTIGEEAMELGGHMAALSYDRDSGVLYARIWEMVDAHWGDEVFEGQIGRLSDDVMTAAMQASGGNLSRFGDEIEEPIRMLAEGIFGQMFRKKLPSANGPDLLPFF